MPIAKLCSHAACRTIVRDGSYRCELHRYNHRTNNVKERGRFYSTQRWKKFSLGQRQLRPVCEMCNKELASDADHFIERAIDPLELYWFDERNIICMCKRCHMTKSNKMQHWIKNNNYEKIYQWCLVNHPRQDSTGYLHDWIKTKVKERT